MGTKCGFKRVLVQFSGYRFRGLVINFETQMLVLYWYRGR